MIRTTRKPLCTYVWLVTSRIEPAKMQTAWKFNRQTPGGAKKKKNPGALFEPEYDFKIQGMAPVDFGTNDFVASIRPASRIEHKVDIDMMEVT